MDYEGKSWSSSAATQVAQNTAAIEQNTVDIQTNVRRLALCTTNPTNVGDLEQVQVSVDVNEKPLLEQGMGISSGIGLLSSAFVTHPSLSFGTGASGSPMDIRYATPSEEAVAVKMRINLMLNLVFPSQLVAYTARVYLFVGLYNSNVSQGGYFVLDGAQRTVLVPPGGKTTSVTIFDYIFQTVSLVGIDEIRVTPIIESSYVNPLTPASISIVQNWERPVANVFSVEIL
jgi:hypothetical protein